MSDTGFDEQAHYAGRGRTAVSTGGCGMPGSVMARALSVASACVLSMAFI